MSALDNFYQNLERSVGLRTDAVNIAAPTRARLIGISVGELAQAVKFSGLSLFTGHDGVIEIRRVDSQTKEIQR